MRRWLVFVLCLGSLLFPAAAGAEDGTKFESIHIELWAEFDQPSMLVISEFVVSQETSLPAAVTMRFPKEGNLIAVAYGNSGNLYMTPFSGPVEQGDWQTITINVQRRDPYQIEYYQPLGREGDKRRFAYQWFGEYDVKEFAVNTLLPADSTNIVTSPPLSSTEVSVNGLNLIGTLNLGEMKS